MIYHWYACAFLILFASPNSGQLLWYYVTPFLSTRGVAVLRANGTGELVGNVQFTQNTLYGPVTIQGLVNGLAPRPHRVMVHQLGDMTNGCSGIGPLFNPEPVPGPLGPRTIGDLGTIQADVNGMAQIILTDSIITLHGRNEVIGRALAIHELTGPIIGNSLSNVGPTVACGVIGLAAEIP